MADILTRVDRFGDWYAKREDLAGYTGDGAPSGAKVRQYVGMIANSDPSATLMVGCSADSAMQVYVSHAAATHGRTGIVVVPKRKARSDATEYAIAMGRRSWKCHRDAQVCIARDAAKLPLSEI